MNLQILVRQNLCHFLNEQIMHGSHQLLMRNSGRLLLLPAQILKNTKQTAYKIFVRNLKCRNSSLHNPPPPVCMHSLHLMNSMPNPHDSPHALRCMPSLHIALSTPSPDATLMPSHPSPTHMPCFAVQPCTFRAQPTCCTLHAQATCCAMHAHTTYRTFHAKPISCLGCPARMLRVLGLSHICALHHHMGTLQTLPTCSLCTSSQHGALCKNSPHVALSLPNSLVMIPLPSSQVTLCMPSSNIAFCW